MTCFFVNCLFENDISLLFLRIYDVIRIIVMTCFLLITYLKMTCSIILRNCDIMFFC